MMRQTGKPILAIFAAIAGVASGSFERESKLTRSLLAIVSIALTAAFALPARAQDVLPRPEQPFKGHIGRTVEESTTDFPQEVKAPKGAPNVLLILTDDVGFGASSTFGGPVPTPTMDRLANEGLRYTQFHTTALCSPTRAALLTGRNHHSAATGIIMEVVPVSRVTTRSCRKVSERSPRC